MTASDLARRHFAAALVEARTAGIDPDIVCRSMLGFIVAKYLETRRVSDVQSELHFVADNCDPDTDHIFMRP